MAETYKFFNSEPDDIREYEAGEFTDYFKRFLSDGIYTENGEMGLRVTKISGFNIQIDTGYAFIDGKEYHNDTPIEFTLDSSDNVLDRIDRVVLKLDIINRKINATLKTGDLGSQPQPPEISNTENIIELPIAKIKVNNKSTEGEIFDERFPVSSLIEIPYEDMVREFDAWFQDVKESIKVEGDSVTFTDKAEVGDYTGVKYRMVVEDGQPYMEVISV